MWNTHWNEKAKLHRHSLGLRQKHTFLTTSAQTKKQNRGLKSAEEQNCFPRNKTCQKNLAQIFPNAPIVAYRKDKQLKDILVRARTPTLKS